MQPILKVSFYTNGNTEPVRDWLKSLSGADKKIIGEDIKTVQYGWPLGMPLVGHIIGDLWEVRIKLDNRIARVLFCLENANMVLLHGFIKKTQKTPDGEIDIAKNRLKDALHKSWFDRLTTNEINYLPFVLSLSKDLIRVSLNN